MAKTDDNAKPQSETAGMKPVTYKDQPAVISGEDTVNKTVDLHIVDANGEIVRDANNQPVWYSRIPAADVTPRK